MRRVFAARAYTSTDGDCEGVVTLRRGDLHADRHAVRVEAGAQRAGWQAGQVLRARRGDDEPAEVDLGAPERARRPADPNRAYW